MDHLDRKKCVVANCKNKKLLDKEVIGHKFPANRSVGLKWVESTGNEQLKKLPYETITSKRYFICRGHFDERDIFKTPRGLTVLNRSAVPSLNLPVPLDSKRQSYESDVNIDLPDEVLNVSSNLKVEPIFSSPTKGKMEVLRTSPESDVRRSSLHFANVSFFFF